MPIREYRCQDCRRTFEAVEIGEVDAVCPYCSCTRLDRLLSVPANPQFRGTGWYASDYAKKS